MMANISASNNDNADIKSCLKNSWAKTIFFEFRLTSNPRIPEYQDLAFCLRIPTQGRLLYLYEQYGTCSSLELSTL
jgi:hypothetical protein